MADLVGEQYIPTGPDPIVGQIISDIRLGALAEGLDEPPTGPGSDNYNIAVSIANVALIGLQNQKIQNENMSVFDARGDKLHQLLLAEGLPEVKPSGASGKVRPKINGSTTITANQVLIRNGVIYKVLRVYINPQDGDEIDVQATSTGKLTNAKGGEELVFLSPPPNVETKAKVSYSSPLTGGTDGEEEERKRTRILNKRQSGPAGSWGHVRELVTNADASIQDCYVYPALGGPSSVKVVPVRKMDPEEYEFTRVCSEGQLFNARKAVFGVYPDGVDVVVQAAVNQSVDFGLEFKLPAASISEGGGGGWVDSSPWPVLESADNGKVSITAVALNGKQITVSAETAIAPTPLNTSISWWSSVDKKFYSTLVIAQSGSAGAWVLTLQTPFRDHNGDSCIVGEFISPAAEKVVGYGKTWVNLFQRFGPGENSASAYVATRAFRHPKVTTSAPSDWADSLLSEFTNNHPEITGVQREYASATTATIPALRATGPSIFIPGHFGIYPLQ